MALTSLVTATDGTIRATTWVGLLYEAVLLGHHLQGRYNRAKPKFKRNGISIDYKFDGETTSLVAKVSLEGQRVVAAGTTKPVFQLDSTLGDYLVDAAGAPTAFDGGTGVLAGVTSYEQALADVTEMVSYLESQIEPDQLLKEINIANLTPSPEDGNATLDVSIPLRNGWDETTGQAFITPKNYLYILDVPDTEAI
jgi:hypothetical protein